MELGHGDGILHLNNNSMISGLQAASFKHIGGYGGWINLMANKVFRVRWPTSLITPASATQIASLATHWQKATGCTIVPWPYVLTPIAGSGFIAKGMCWIYCQSSGRTLLEEPNKRRMERINMNLHEIYRYSEYVQFHLPGF